MGYLTVAEILKQGTELAQVAYDSNDPKPLTWLKQWLRSVSLGFPWPETEAVVNATLSAGEYLVELGRSASVANGKFIIRVNFPIQQLYEDCAPNLIYQEAYNDSVILNPNNLSEGLPDKASYTRDWEEPGRVAIIFNKRAKEDYTLSIKFQWDPANALLITDYPWYPNDNTLIQALAWKTSYYHDGPDTKRTVVLADDLAGMLRDDKVKFGVINPPFTGLSRRFAGK